MLFTVKTVWPPHRPAFHTGSACCPPGAVQQGWRLNRQRWRHFHVVGRNMKKTNTPNSRGQGGKSARMLLQFFWILLNKLNVWDKKNLTDRTACSVNILLDQNTWAWKVKTTSKTSSIYSFTYSCIWTWFDLHVSVEFLSDDLRITNSCFTVTVQYKTTKNL